MRDSDDNTRISKQGPWARTADMINGTNRMLAGGASWSGNERNHLFFGGLPNHQFERLSGISGLDDPADSRAFATLDFDHDGALDIVLANVSAPRTRLLHNEISRLNNDNRFVAIRLVGGNQSDKPSGEWSSRDGLGTKIELDLGGGSKVYREHRVDDGFKAQNSSTLIIGIGPRDSVRSIKLRWLSGREQTIADVPAGTLLTIYENPSNSPTGNALVSAAYGSGSQASNTRLSRSARDWKAGLLPREPSKSSLVVGGSKDRGDAKTG